MVLPNDVEMLPCNTTVVAIDKDKNSQYAVKWAIDHLLTGTNFIILVHVKQRNNSGGSEGSMTTHEDCQQIFIPYRGFCARKSVQVKEVVLEETDVVKALLDYVHSNYTTNIVLGASSRNALVKTFKKPDVPSSVNKHAPEFCSVYVIARSKVLSVRSAQRPIANTVAPPKLPSPPAVTNQLLVDHASNETSSRTPSFRGYMHATGSEKYFTERNSENNRGTTRPQALQSGSWKSPNLSMESIDVGTLSAHGSISDGDIDPLAFHNSLDMTNKNYDFSIVGEPRREEYNTPGDLEAEMKRLKLELKQTMDMYNKACKEAITAKHKARELNDWKKEELRRLEQAKYAEESALAIVEMEKAKCRAAMEAADAAQRLAEKEAQKRKLAEIKARKEAAEKNKALTVLAQNDIRYRKYTIDEIEEATEKFAPQFKIGEGGYGPVYRGKLDHTPVAIKVLRPDAAQGQKQFQQEVEILSCMRHPHMVLLLGACPEYGCLVYEYMDFGSLEDRLHRRGGTPPIPWRIRFKVAAEIAIALTFLHQAKPEPLVHRDLKPGNILLDHNYVSKISDVGLARLVPPSVADTVTQYHMTSAAGTFCYIDPEYQQTGKLTTKSDVYSLGIMLLQIITAKSPMGLSHHVRRAIDQGKLNEMLDSSVQDWPINETLAFAKIALACCELRKKDRPDLATVVLPELNRLRDFGMSDDGYNFFYNQAPNTTTSKANVPVPRSRVPGQMNQQHRVTELSQGSTKTGPWGGSQSSDD